MKPTKEFPLDHRPALVFDDLLKPAEVLAVQAMFVQVPFERRESFDNELNYGMTSEEFAQFPRLPALLDELFESVRGRYGIDDPDVQLGHAYAAVFHPGDEPAKHTDGKTSQAMSFVYYANPLWRPSWGGETRFFDDAGEVTVRVPPRPGRIVAFPANVMHSATAQQPNAPLLRHTISIFYYAPAEDSEAGK